MKCRLEKKLRKKQMGANQRDESKWPKCLFWISKCSRFCSGDRAPNSKYCVNHMHMSGSASENAGSERKRVVCPIDPSHTVFEDRLEKHMRVCNKNKQERAKSSCSFFIPNFNCGNQLLTSQMQFSSPDEVQQHCGCDA